MKFVYKPSGTSEKKWRRWEFAPAKMTNRDAEDIEDLTGWTFLEWQDKFFAGSIKAARALLFVYLRRDEPGLAYDDVAFCFEEYDVEPDDADKRALEAVAGAAEGDDEGKAPKAS